MKLKGIELKGTYKVEHSDDIFYVFDEKGNVIYYERNDGFWIKQEFNEQRNRIYYENSNGVIIDKRLK